MISKFFIEHPVLANVLAIVLIVLGAVSLYRLPVSEYPNVVPPTVQVTASYAGASAQTVMNTIALPIENQVNGVDKMLYMESTSAPDGTYTLTVTFEIGTDPNIDQVLVQNRVQLALASLPYPVQSQGVSVQKKNTAILQIVTLEFAGRQVRQPVHGELRDDQPRSTCWRACPASAASRCSAPAPTPCASGWTRRSCSPSACSRRT